MVDIVDTFQDFTITLSGGPPPPPPEGGTSPLIWIGAAVLGGILIISALPKEGQKKKTKK